MKKRDIVHEITTIKSRKEFNHQNYVVRLNNLDPILKWLKENEGEFNEELLKYIPVATVACFEAFFNSAVQEIIELGKPYSENVAKFNQSKNIKLDFEVLAAVETRTFTISEFIAHLLGYSSLEEINFNLGILLGKDFLKELKSFRLNNNAESNTDNTSEIFHNKTGEILESVKQTFELRHIFCHEFSNKISIDEKLIHTNFDNCKVFLNHCNSFLWEVILPDYSPNKNDFYLRIQDEFEKLDENLNDLIEKIKHLSKSKDQHSLDEALFDQSFKAWIEYRRLDAECRSVSHQGSSLYPFILKEEMIFETQIKIINMESEYRALLDGS